MTLSAGANITGLNHTVDRDHVRDLKQSIRKNNRDHQTLLADTLHSQLSPFLKRCADLAREPGSSSWLTVLPIPEHGFHLHKGDFRDALFLCYGITPLNTSKTCQCGTSFSVDHAMVCPLEAFLQSGTMRSGFNCFSAHRSFS